MVAKSKSANILNDILNDSHTGAIRGLDELNELIRRPVAAQGALHPAKQSESAIKKGRAGLVKGKAKPAKRRAKKRLKAGTKKTTHYLSEKVFEDLGEAKQMISDYLPTGKKLRASKSKIVNTAVKVLLQEFEEKGKESTLVKMILKKKQQD